MQKGKWPRKPVFPYLVLTATHLTKHSEWSVLEDYRVILTAQEFSSGHP